MKYIKGYKIFEAKKGFFEWVTDKTEVKEHFYDLEDDCKIDVSHMYISEDLEEFSPRNRPGVYPGFIVIVTPKFTNLDFDKYQNYIKNISGINQRLPQYFEKYNIIADDQESDSQPTRYKFVFLDVNYKTFTWDDDLIYKDTFMRTFGNLSLRYGNTKTHRQGSTIRYDYVEPVGKVKSDINIESIKQYINQRFSDYDIQISEEEGGKGKLGKPLITSVSITCLGKKKK